MPQSLSSILVHLVFSTKHRQPLINAEIEHDLHAYLSTVFNGCDSSALTIGGDKDHIHALFALGRTWAVADVVEEVKKRSSKWIKHRGVTINCFNGSQDMERSRLVNLR